MKVTMSTNVGNYQLPWLRQTSDTSGINSWRKLSPNCIDELYATNLKEEDRGNFEETFPEGARFKIVDEHLYTPNSESSQPYDFYNSLIDNKQYLTNTLDLTSEEYDALSCIALALASQETGMGYEEGYNEENTFKGGILRKLGIFFTSDNSASSGLTQIKIYDRAQEFVQIYRSIMQQRGVKFDGKVSDNLDDPEKSAIATMVLLKTISLKYNDYEKTMNEKNEELKQEFANQGIDPQEAENKGFDYLSQIYQAYQNSTDEQKVEIRVAFKQLLKSTDGSTRENPSPDGKEYTEEIQFERLQEALGDNVVLEDDALSYMKLALSNEICQMDMIEYCAYAWNSGTGDTGMQPDRIMAEKIGIILSDPEDFDYDQYSANVVSLTERYAQQAGNAKDRDEAYSMMQEALKDLNKKGTH